jgi:hypothetical protein
MKKKTRSPCIRQRTTPRRSRKETKDDQGPYVPTGDDATVEDGEQDVGEYEEVASTEYFGEGGPEEWTDDESEDEAGCDCERGCGCGWLRGS